MVKGDSAATLFSAMLQWKPSGEGSIALAGRQLGDAGAQAWAAWALARKKQKGERLKVADFSDNGLTDTGFQCIVAALIKLWPEVRVLKAFKNQISNAKAGIDMIQLGNLTELHLSHNAFTAQSIASLVSTAVASGYPRHGDAPLWLRLEHNVHEGDATLAKYLQPLLKDICIVDGCTRCNPLFCAQRQRKPPAVHLLYIALGKREETSPSKAVGSAAWRRCAPRPGPSQGWAQTSSDQAPCQHDAAAMAPPHFTSTSDFPSLQAQKRAAALHPRPPTAWMTRCVAKARQEKRGRGIADEEAANTTDTKSAEAGVGAQHGTGRSPDAPAVEAEDPVTMPRPALGHVVPSGAPRPIARGMHVQIIAAYASEGGGYLSVSAGQMGVLGSAFAEAGYERDVWPEYVYVSIAEHEGGWVPWELCRPLGAIPA